MAISRSGRGHWDDNPRWMFLHMVSGHIAMWAVRQSPYHWPDGLQDVLSAFSRAVRAADAVDQHDMLETTPAGLERLMAQCLTPQPLVQAWNAPKIGNHTLVFVDRYSQPAPDYDFIDLDALTRNVTMSVFRELDADAAFDEAFDAAGLQPVEAVAQEVRES